MTRGAGAIRRLRAMVLKEVRHILRDRQTLFIVLAMPVAMMVLYGYALTLDVRDARVVVEMPAFSDEAQHIVGALDAATLSKVVVIIPPVADPTHVLKRYSAKALIRIPPNLATDLRNGGSPPGICVIIDGTDPNVGTILSNALPVIVHDAVARSVRLHLMQAVDVHISVLYNPEQKTALFLVPGLMAVLLIMVSSLLTALAITREKELGTMEQLLVSPVRPWEVIIGKLVPYVVIATADAVLIIGAGRALFGISIHGSAWVLAVAAVLYVTTGLAIGLTVSTFAHNQTQAMLMVMPPTMMPTVVLSGFIFPVSSFPIWLYILAHVVPATYFLRIIRGVMLKGVGFNELWRPMAILLLISLFLLTVAMRNFRMRMK